jgi:hypothetical protein
MTFPAQSFTTGQVLTAAQMNEISTEINDLWRYTYRTVSGTSDTLLLADSYNKAISYSNTGTTTITIPNSSSVAFTTGAIINILKTGTTGTVNIVQGSGVTIQSAGTTSTSPVITGSGAFARIIKTGGDSFIVEGNLAGIGGGGGGGGKVLQVVQGTTSTSTTVASATFTDTNLSASITPSSASSKILVLVSQSLYSYREANLGGGAARILRGATEVVNGYGSNFNSTHWLDIGNRSGNYVVMGAFWSYQYLDSPNTTSSTTYKTQIRANNTANAGSLIANESSATGVITLLEIGA